MPEIKELTESVQSAVKAMRDSAVRMDDESKKLGEATAETKSAFLKANERIDALELELKRMTVPKIEKDSKGKEISPEAAKARKAFWSWIKKGRANMEPDERKALVEDSTGGVMVPEDLDTEVTTALPQLTPIAALCMQRPTSRDKIRRRTLNEVTVAWGKLETGALVHESSLIPTDANIYVEDINGLTKIGKDELDDTEYNLQAHLARSFSQAIAVALDKGIMIGTGHSYQQPEGVAVDATLRTGIGYGGGAGAAGTYGNNWTADDTVALDDLLECEYALPKQYLAGATWVLARKTELAMRVLKAATTGTYLWQPGLQAGMPSTFDGFPIVNSADLLEPKAGDWTTNVVFGNFKLGYVVLQRQGIKLQRLDELYAESGLVGFLVSYRAGGGLLRYDTFQIISNDD